MGSIGQKVVSTTACCANCRHFSNSAQMLEIAIPGLRVLGSGYSAVRGSDGLCALHERYLSGRYRCDAFEARIST
jgi:hypothetical protein